MQPPAQFSVEIRQSVSSERTGGVLIISPLWDDVLEYFTTAEPSEILELRCLLVDVGA